MTRHVLQACNFTAKGFTLDALLVLEAIVPRCSVKKVLIEILQNLQENTCVRVSFLIKLQAVLEHFLEVKSLDKHAGISLSKHYRYISA